MSSDLRPDTNDLLSLLSLRSKGPVVQCPPCVAGEVAVNIPRIPLEYRLRLAVRVPASVEHRCDNQFLERFIEVMQNKLPDLDYEGKQLALEMLDITVWLDNDTIEITGSIEPNLSVIATTHSL